MTLEASPKSEYVDPFWEVVQRQQVASKRVQKVASQIESSILAIGISALWQHEDNLKRRLEIQAPQQKRCKKGEQRNELHY